MELTLKPLVRTVTGLWNKMWSSLKPFEESDEQTTTVTGKPYDSYLQQVLKMYDIFGIGDPDYLKSVQDCKKLTEYNPVFSAIMRKVVKPVAQVKTTIKVHSILGNDGDSRIEDLEYELNELVRRTFWNENKDEYLKNMLNEGGLSVEVIVDHERLIQGLEYRPHYSIIPLTDLNKRFPDPELAYKQIDVSTGDPVAFFAKWQILERNWEESSFHDRGIPYLQSARKTLEAVGDMINGMVQKWIRSGGELEVFMLKDANNWEDVEEFKRMNRDSLTPTQNDLIRQFFGRGDILIDRKHGDKLDNDTQAIEFLLEIIFMAVGVPKEILGFKSHVVIKDMAELSESSYTDLLQAVQDKSHWIFRKACDFQILLLNQRFHLLPEDIDYTVIGKEFKKESQDKVVDRATKIVDILIKVMGQMNLGGEERKAELLAKIGMVLEKELADYELNFQEMKDITPEEIAKVKEEKMQEEMARLQPVPAQLPGGKK
ncbi:MAG: hypothetical protein EH225_01710 [Calditrichaeota bacterium]|nr:MAG: hypothetical protein EH225_01710 [Calditrichota bacterium]